MAETESSMVRAMNIVGFPEEYKDNPKMYLKTLLFLLNGRGRFRNMFRDREFIQIAEVAIRCFPIRDAREIADIIVRNIPNSACILPILNKREATPPPKAIKNTVYADRQNVHNSTINKSVIRAVETIWKQRHEPVPDLEHIELKLMERFPEDTELILLSMQYIRDNTSYFGQEKVTLEQALKSIFQRFERYPEHSDTLHSRLLEELREMEGQCTTGHLARLVNILQGFETDPDTCIKISLEDQCNSVVRYCLQKELSNCNDEKVLEGVLTGSDEFVKFIKGVVKNRIKEWHTTYGNDGFPWITKAINDFCGTVVFEK